MGEWQGTMEEMVVRASFKPSSSFWRGRRVLITGHTGFKGAWLTLWLTRLGARVTGLSLAPTSNPNLFQLLALAEQCDSHIGDIRDIDVVRTVMTSAQPEVVFHLAAQPLVRESYNTPVDTFAINVMGTAHVLETLRELKNLRVAVIATTDKVYKNLEHPYPYREEDALGGHDPYSASKAASELVVASFRDAFLAERAVAVATVRAGNVIGGGDWSANRLIPDAVRAWSSGSRLEVRRPDAIRPWQHVLDPLAGYLMLAEKLWSTPALAGAWNFGPLTHEAATVRMAVEQARVIWGECEVSYGDGLDGPHEAGWLALETAKARIYLGHASKWSFTDAIARTVTWYRQHASGRSARELCEEEIAAYEAEI